MSRPHASTNYHTNSYVEAVKHAVRRAEIMGDDYWLDKWRRNMISIPRISNHREA